MTYTLSGATIGTGTTLDQVAFNEGTTTVTWTATDYCGNTVQCTPFTVTVNAKSDLSVTKAASPSPVIAGAMLTYTMVITNNGSATATGIQITDPVSSLFTDAAEYSTDNVTWFPWTSPFNYSGTIASHGGTAPFYIRGHSACSSASLINTVTVTASNGVNTNNTATVNTQVIDQVFPVFTYCPNLQIVCSNNGTAYTNSGISWDAIATDNCVTASPGFILSGATTGSGSTLNGQSFNEGVTEVTWRLTDNSGNTADCGFSVTVIPTSSECSITGPDNVCPATLNTYSGPTSAYEYNPYTYTWSVVSGTAYIVGATNTKDIQVMAPTTCSTFTLRLTVPNYCGSKTCDKIFTVTDTQNPTASNPPPINITGNSATFPDPDTGVVTDAADNCGIPTVTFLNDGTPSVANCIQTTIRTYRVTDACGNHIDVTQNLIRTMTGITASTGVTAACHGTATGTATITAINGTPPYTYSWNTTPGQTTQTAIGLAAGTYVGTVTDANGCTATASATVTELPSFTAPVVSASQSICENIVPSALTATPALGGSGSYSYQWESSPDGITWTPISGATTLSYSPPALTVTTYYRIVATDNGASTCGAINSLSVTITVNPVITPTFDPVPAICAGATLSPLPATSLNGITGIWLPALNNTATTTYTFTPDSGQCANTATMQITVNPLPGTSLIYHR